MLLKAVDDTRGITLLQLIQDVSYPVRPERLFLRVLWKLLVLRICLCCPFIQYRLVSAYAIKSARRPAPPKILPAQQIRSAEISQHGPLPIDEPYRYNHPTLLVLKQVSLSANPHLQNPGECHNH